MVSIGIGIANRGLIDGYSMCLSGTPVKVDPLCWKYRLWKAGSAQTRKYKLNCQQNKTEQKRKQKTRSRKRKARNKKPGSTREERSGGGGARISVRPGGQGEARLFRKNSPGYSEKKSKKKKRNVRFWGLRKKRRREEREQRERGEEEGEII